MLGSADPVASGAGQAGGALRRVPTRLPRGPRQHREARRLVGNQASDDQGLSGKSAMQYLSMGTNVKRGAQTAASRVMRTGTPQRLAMKRGNALGAKVLTFGRLLR
jgi:hypothetical protein